MPLLWTEARCQYIQDHPATDDFGQSICMETSSGVFARTLRAAVAEIKSQGWRVVNDDWVCPRCAAQRKEGD